MIRCDVRIFRVNTVIAIPYNGIFLLLCKNIQIRVSSE